MTAGIVQDTPFALHGAFRSGTNFVRYLLEENFQARFTDVYGWKHGPVAIAAAGMDVTMATPLFAVVKNPASFCASLFRYYKKVGKNILAPTRWRDFLRQKLVIANDTLAASPQYRFANPVEYWNFLNWNLASLPQNRAALMRYEDLLQDQENVLTAAATRLGFARRSGPWKSPSEVMARRGASSPPDKPATVAGVPFDQARYDARAYLNRFTASDLDFLWKQADSDLLSRLGYYEERPA